jgi:phenylacetate-coenzyme A ligase PaaK-like adenylate-forming protein
VLWDIAYTTGTTSGRPSPFYNTAHDAYAIWDQARRCNEAEGLTASDRVANLYPLAGFPTGAFLSVIRSTMIAGLPVVHGLTGSANSEFKVRNSLAEALATVARFRPTVLWGVPSFIRRFLDEACRLVPSEPVGDTPRRAPLPTCRVGAPIAIRARYAFTKMGQAGHGAEGAAPQNLVPDLYHLEVVESDTGRSPETAERARHHPSVHRRGTVLLRYLVGDIVTLSRTPCRSAAARASGCVYATPATWSEMPGNAGQHRCHC